MSITSGFKKTKKYRKLSDGNYQLQSEWTSASTVEMSDGKTVETAMTTHDTQNNITTFTNEDCETSAANEWTNIVPLTSGETHQSIFTKMGTMFRNIRYLFKELGTTDISSIGDGTVKGAVSTLNSNLNKLDGMMCITNQINIFNDSFSAYETKEYELNVPDIGEYTPVGVVGLAYNSVYIQCISFWVLSNKLHAFAYNTLNTDMNNIICNAIVLYSKNIN